MFDGTQVALGCSDASEAAANTSVGSTMGGIMSTRISDLLRPDRRLLVRPTDDWTAEAAAEAVDLANDRRVPAVTHVEEDESGALAALAAAGFTVSRRDAEVALPVESALDALPSTAIAEGLGARRLGTTIELVYEPAREVSGVR